MEHIVLERSLNQLRTLLLEIMDHANAMMETSIKAFFSADPKLSNTVIHTLEKRMNELEVILEEKCIENIAIHQPQAKHLRFVVMIVKINSDLERIGDLAMSIASHNLEILNLNSEFKLDIHSLQALTNQTINVYKLMHEAFVEEDTEKAIAVIQNDATINALRDEAVKIVLEEFKNQPRAFDAFYPVIRIIQRLERIGDLCKNIAEDILYIVDGSIYKH